MSLIIWLSVALAIVVPVWRIWKLGFSQSGRFWRRVAARPDIAIAFFRNDPACVLDTEPLKRNDYVGPFDVVDSGGRKRRLFILRERISEVQVRCMEIIDSATALLRREVKFKADRGYAEKPSGRPSNDP